MFMFSEILLLCKIKVYNVRHESFVMNMWNYIEIYDLFINYIE